MISSRNREALLHDALFGAAATDFLAPSVDALRALRGRRRRRRAVRMTTGMAALACLLFAGWWAFQRKVVAPAPPAATPTWLVLTQEMKADDLVRTELLVAVVRTPSDFPSGLVVHTRPGLFAPLSDEGLLAMLADRSPVLIGAPGQRQLIFQPEDSTP